MKSWLLLITNLPGRNQTLRMRLWRALKSAGAASLRDGVYLLPASANWRQQFESQAAVIQSAKGGATILAFEADSPEQQGRLQALFDRSADYAGLLAELGSFRRKLPKLTEPAARRALESLRRELKQLAASDFFPGAAQRQATGALADTEVAVSVRFSPDEPHTAHFGIMARDRTDYRGRTWATRQRPWVDRLCSAWLIKRFIDPQARFVWLKRIKDCPRRAVGFDFDGAEFTHVDEKVTFEVLVSSFGLDGDAGLARLASVVHYLDVGGVPVAEASGLAAFITGARALQPRDSALLEDVLPMLDRLYATFSLTERP